MTRTATWSLTATRYSIRSPRNPRALTRPGITLRSGVCCLPACAGSMVIFSGRTEKVALPGCKRADSLTRLRGARSVTEPLNVERDTHTVSLRSSSFKLSAGKKLVLP